MRVLWTSIDFKNQQQTITIKNNRIMTKHVIALKGECNSITPSFY
jgi:hypothetical protein